MSAFCLILGRQLDKFRTLNWNEIAMDFQLFAGAFPVFA